MSQPATNQGSVYTCGFTRPGGYQALAVWNTNRTATSTFTVPNGYIQYRDLAGNLYSITGSTVTIGIEPILLENMNEPTFSGLTSPTVTYGTTNANIDGHSELLRQLSAQRHRDHRDHQWNAQGTTISDPQGILASITALPGLLANVYPVTYSRCRRRQLSGRNRHDHHFDGQSTVRRSWWPERFSDGAVHFSAIPPLRGRLTSFSTRPTSSGTWLPAAGDPVSAPACQSGSPMTSAPQYRCSSGCP